MSIRIFYSYSHRDERYKDTLQTHLAILKRQEYIQEWHDRRIAPGENWKEEIDLNLERANIVLLLVSSNFLASDYCYDTETVFALEQHSDKKSIVVPIIIKPCLWDKSHFSHLQALPKNGKPITTWKNKDEAWLDVANGLVRVIEQCNKNKTAIETIFEGKKNVFIAGHGVLVEKDKLQDNNKSELHLTLRDIVEKFLQQFNRFYFSPLRIAKWGAKQSGFEILSNYTSQAIKRELEILLQNGKVTVILSKKGNRIYKINEAQYLIDMTKALTEGSEINKLLNKHFDP